MKIDGVEPDKKGCEIEFVFIPFFRLKIIII